MHKSPGKSENIIDRILSKCKMAKRGAQQTANVNPAEVAEKNDARLADDGEIADATEVDGESHKVSLQNLPAFCEQLEKFIKYIRSVRELQFLIHDYPAIVKNRFDNDVAELLGMLREINSALTNINKQKVQRNYVKKDKMAVKKNLKKIRDDEFREMEKVVALYDKPLFARWESVKTTHRPEVLRSFLTDIKCKQLALENLDALVTRKLGHVKSYSSLTSGNNDKRSETTIPLPYTSICPAISENSGTKKSRIPLPPPLPPPPSASSRNKAQSGSERRRTRPEIAEITDSRYSLLRDIDDFLEIQSPTLANLPNSVIVSLNGNYPEVSSSSQYSDDNFDELLAASLQDEMRNVLQVSDDFSHSV